MAVLEAILVKKCAVVRVRRIVSVGVELIPRASIAFQRSVS